MRTMSTDVYYTLYDGGSAVVMEENLSFRREDDVLRDIESGGVVYVQGWMDNALSRLSADRDIRAEFLRGYRDGNGDPRYEEYFVNVVIPCESSWIEDNENNPGYYGLAQFSEWSWLRVAGVTGYYDWANAYHQGFNVAVWIRMTDPRSQWSCF